MPVKHIPEAIWRKVEKEVVKAVQLTQMSIKESTVIEILLKRGIENITKDDYLAIKTKREEKEKKVKKAAD